MADDTPKNTLSAITETLKQISKELIEAGDRQAKVADQQQKELIEAGDRQAKVADQQQKELIEIGDRQAKQAKALIEAGDRQAKVADQQQKELIEIGDRQAKQAKALIEAGDRQAKVADQQNKELIEAGNRQAKELDRQAKFNKKLLDRIEGRESNRMGRISESVVANIIAWFMDNHFGIKISDVFREVKIELRKLKHKTGSEIDVLAIGDQAIVVIEVKTTINKDHITDFSQKIVRNFANVELIDTRNIQIPNFKNKKLYGGVAFIGVARDSNEHTIVTTAEQHGLFAMKIMGKNSVELCNTKKNYQPKRHKT